MCEVCGKQILVQILRGGPVCSGACRKLLPAHRMQEKINGYVKTVRVAVR